MKEEMVIVLVGAGAFLIAIVALSNKLNSKSKEAQPTSSNKPVKTSTVILALLLAPLFMYVRTEYPNTLWAIPGLFTLVALVVTFKFRKYLWTVFKAKFLGGPKISVLQTNEKGEMSLSCPVCGTRNPVTKIESGEFSFKCEKCDTRTID